MARKNFSDLRDATRAQQAAHEKAHLLVVVDNQHVTIELYFWQLRIGSRLR